MKKKNKKKIGYILCQLEQHEWMVIEHSAWIQMPDVANKKEGLLICLHKIRDANGLDSGWNESLIKTWICDYRFGSWFSTEYIVFGYTNFSQRDPISDSDLK